MQPISVKTASDTHTNLHFYWKVNDSKFSKLVYNYNIAPTKLKEKITENFWIFCVSPDDGVVKKLDWILSKLVDYPKEKIPQNAQIGMDTVQGTHAKGLLSFLSVQQKHPSYTKHCYKLHNWSNLEVKKQSLEPLLSSSAPHWGEESHDGP